MKLAGSWQKPVTLCWQCWLVKLVLTLMMNTSQGQHNTSHYQPANCTTVTLKRKEKLLKVTTSNQPTVQFINIRPLTFLHITGNLNAGSDSAVQSGLSGVV